MPAIDYTQRPSLAPERLAQVTNTLAHWLPRDDEDVSAVSRWIEADWAAAVWVVYWQNALPWMAQRVRRTETPVPEAIRSQLFQLDAGCRERTRCMMASVVEILGVFADNGIEAIPFKGAVMVALYYPTPLIRPLADLDLLIHQSDMAAGVVLLKRLGYRFYSRSAEDEVYLRGERKQNVWAPDNVHPVELHYTLREEYAGVGYNLAELMWQSSQKRPFWGEHHARLPDTPAMLHHVCAHASSDWLIQRGRLMQIDDIRKLCLHMTEADWETFLTAVLPDGARFVYPALALAGKYTALATPAAVLGQLRGHCPPALLDWIGQTELAAASESNAVLRSGIGFDIAFRLAHSRSEKVRFWLRSFFPRRYNLSKRYPRLVQTPFWPLCYLLLNGDRVWHLARKRLAIRS